MTFIRLVNLSTGIRQSDGEFDLKRFHMGKYRGYVTGRSIDETKKRIDALISAVGDRV